MPISILSIGIATIDHVFHVKQLPNRAEKYRADQAETVGGGGGANAAVAISRLGGTASIAARTGGDEVANSIEYGFNREGVRTDLLRQYKERRSSYSMVLIDAEGERLIVNYRDDRLPFDARWLERELAQRNFDAVLADTRWPDGAVAGMRYASDRGVPGVIDAEAPVEGCEEALRLASHVVFSAQGLRDFHGADPQEADLGALLRCSDCGEGVVGVTNGAEGIRWMENGTIRHILPPPLPGPLTDTLGAGDIWHGALALALAEEQGLTNAMRFANAAATLKCAGASGRNGAPRREEVERFLRFNETRLSEANGNMRDA